MTRLPAAFVTLGVVFLLLGMIWGIQMSASGDHSLAPAHGHLMLLGFVVMTLSGLYYALTPVAAASRLARAHLAATASAVIVLVPGIVMALTGAGEGLAKLGSVLALASAGLMLVTVLRFGVGNLATEG